MKKQCVQGNSLHIWIVTHIWGYRSCQPCIYLVSSVPGTVDERVLAVTVEIFYIMSNIS